MIIPILSVVGIFLLAKYAIPTDASIAREFGEGLERAYPSSGKKKTKNRNQENFERLYKGSI